MTVRQTTTTLAIPFVLELQLGGQGSTFVKLPSSRFWQPDNIPGNVSLSVDYSPFNGWSCNGDGLRKNLVGRSPDEMGLGGDSRSLPK